MTLIGNKRYDMILTVRSDGGGTRGTPRPACVSGCSRPVEHWPPAGDHTHPGRRRSGEQTGPDSSAVLGKTTQSESENKRQIKITSIIYCSIFVTRN